MQSLPEAALLSQPGDSKIASNVEQDDEKDFQEDDADDDFIDEVFFFSAYICITISPLIPFFFFKFYRFSYVHDLPT